MRHRHFYGNGQVDYHLVLSGRLPYVDNCVAYLQRELGLGAGEAFGRVLEDYVALSLFLVLVAELCAGNGYVDYLLLALAEYLLSLRHGCGVVEVHYRVLCAVDGFKCLFDYVFSRLREHLYAHVVWYHVLLDERAAELILGLARRREAYLDLFKAYLHQLLEKLELFFEAHWYYQRLIAVAKVYRAPHGRLIDVFLFCPLHALYGRHKVAACVLFRIFHVCHSFFLQLVTDLSNQPNQKSPPLVIRKRRAKNPCYHSHSHTTHAVCLSRVYQRAAL